MNLFNLGINSTDNLLPCDGTVNFYGVVFSPEESASYFKYLMHQIAWKNDELKLFGKHIITKRKVAWYADKQVEYSYSGTKKSSLQWNPELIKLKQKVELLTNETFNSCLCNLYHSGEEGMTWHSDAEKELKKNGAIASLSFGAERKFAFKHKRTGETISLVLPTGSLLVMKGETQSNWLHRLPPTKKTQSPRINLTFRTFAG